MAKPVLKKSDRIHFIAGLLWLFASFPASAAVPNTCRIDYPSDASVPWECRKIKSGETLPGLFGDQWENVARFNRIDQRHVYAGVRIKVPRSLKDVINFSPLPAHIDDAQRERRFILIDLSEQFLGAYEYGKLQFSLPIASGDPKQNKDTPTGEFEITAFHRDHSSSLYQIEQLKIAYPMTYALLFHTEDGVRFWIHGRDMPGYPASHGCVGLYDEDMQSKYYGTPKRPRLGDARRLYEWVTEFPAAEDDGKMYRFEGEARVRIVGKAPRG